VPCGPSSTPGCGGRTPLDEYIDKAATHLPGPPDGRRPDVAATARSGVRVAAVVHSMLGNTRWRRDCLAVWCRAEPKLSRHWRTRELRRCHISCPLPRLPIERRSNMTCSPSVAVVQSIELGLELESLRHRASRDESGRDAPHRGTPARTMASTSLVRRARPGSRRCRSRAIAQGANRGLLFAVHRAEDIPRGSKTIRCCAMRRSPGRRPSPRVSAPRRWRRIISIRATRQRSASNSSSVLVGLCATSRGRDTRQLARCRQRHELAQSSSPQSE